MLTWRCYDANTAATSSRWPAGACGCESDGVKTHPNADNSIDNDIGMFCSPQTTYHGCESHDDNCGSQGVKIHNYSSGRRRRGLK